MKIEIRSFTDFREIVLDQELNIHSRKTYIYYIHCAATKLKLTSFGPFLE